jgi:hypothetical protein
MERSVMKDLSEFAEILRVAQDDRQYDAVSILRGCPYRVSVRKKLQPANHPNETNNERHSLDLKCTRNSFIILIFLTDAVMMCRQRRIARDAI